MINKPEFDYYISRTKGGINVQVMKAGNTMVYQFGIIIFTENGHLRIYPYMNGHLD